MNKAEAAERLENIIEGMAGVMGHTHNFRPANKKADNVDCDACKLLSQANEWIAAYRVAQGQPVDGLVRTPAYYDAGGRPYSVNYTDGYSDGALAQLILARQVVEEARAVAPNIIGRAQACDDILKALGK